MKSAIAFRSSQTLATRRSRTVCYAEQPSKKKAVASREKRMEQLKEFAKHAHVEQQKNCNGVSTAIQSFFKAEDELRKQFFKYVSVFAKEDVDQLRNKLVKDEDVQYVSVETDSDSDDDALFELRVQAKTRTP